MPVKPDENIYRLINKILFVNSQEDVVNVIDAEVKELKNQQTGNDYVNRFIENILVNLTLFNPMNKDARQWSNIHMARIHFNRIRKRLSVKVS